MEDMSMKELILIPNDKEKISSFFNEFLTDKNKGQILSFGDRPSFDRHFVTFALIEKLISDNKKVLLVSDNHDLTHFILKNADIDLLKRYQHNLIIINGYALYSLGGNKIGNFLKDWGASASGESDFEYVFIHTNLKNAKSIPKGCGTQETFLDAVKQNATGKTTFLFTYLSRAIVTRNNGNGFLEAKLSDFPKGVVKHSDRLFSITSRQNENDESGIKCSEIQKN